MSCVVCKKKTSIKCSVCQSVYYCSPEHQKENWKIHKEICAPIMKMEDDPVFGEQWVATKHLEPGTLLLTEFPILRSVFWPVDAQVDSYKSKAICLTCGKNIKLKSKYHKCAGCTWPMCSSECAKHPIHAENECKVFKENGFDFPPKGRDFIPSCIDLAVDVARVMTLKRNNEKKFSQLINLQHKPSMDLTPAQEGSEKEDVVVLKKHIDFATSGITDDDVMALPWIRKLNAFKYDKNDTKSGTHCTYLKASKFSNSCAPNCYISIQPQGPVFKIQVQTASAVKNGEALTIEYLTDKPFEGTRERQIKLRKLLYFVCKCKRCVDASELDTYMSAFTCPKCVFDIKDDSRLLEDNEGFMVPRDPLSLDKNAIWHCNRCPNNEVTSSFLDKVKEVQRQLNRGPDDERYFNEIVMDNIGEYFHNKHYMMLWTFEKMVKCMNKKRKDSNFDTHKMHLMHMLSVQEFIHPGLSYWRSLIQLELTEFLYDAAVKSMTRELSEEIQLSKTMIDDCVKFFRNYRNEVPDGAAHWKKLEEMKLYFEDESLM